MVRKRRAERLAVGVPTAAAMLDCSPKYVRTLVRNGQVTASRAGRKLFIRAAELERFLDDRRLLA